MVLYGPQGNSLGLLYALANKFAVFSQVYSTTGKQVSPPSSPSAALANFLYQPTLCLMQNFSPITYLSKGIRWLLCECELVTISPYFEVFTYSKFNSHIVWTERRLRDSYSHEGLLDARSTTVTVRVCTAPDIYLKGTEAIGYAHQPALKQGEDSQAQPPAHLAHSPGLQHCYHQHELKETFLLLG